MSLTLENFAAPVNWRAQLPTLTSRLVSLREPALRDHQALLALLSLADAPRFGLTRPISAEAVQRLIERAAQDRAAGVRFTYAITLNGAQTVIGLLQVRQLDPAFDQAEWDCVLRSSSRGSGAFLEAARLAGSFAFGIVGVRRLEARVPVASGRGNGALRKLGAVQEGVLRGPAVSSGRSFDQALWSVLNEDWGPHWVSTGPRVH
jgi:RimJ/RimL family protein N-acetyltransferase